MKITKTVTMAGLAFELQMIPGQLLDAADHALNLPRMLALAKAFCPVATGTLRDTIRVERPEQTVAKLTAGGVAGGRLVDYARHVHDGTSKSPPRPFLLQAVEAERVNVGDEILWRAVGVT